MTKRMLIDATNAEETRVVVLDGNRLVDYDIEASGKKQLKGNIYLAKVVRVEPSLQAAFVEYGGNRHGFLAFSEIHPDYYQIPVADRQRLIEMQEQEAREYDDEDLPETIDATPESQAHARQAHASQPLAVDQDTRQDDLRHDHAASLSDRAADQADAREQPATEHAAPLPPGLEDQPSIPTLDSGMAPGWNAPGFSPQPSAGDSAGDEDTDDESPLPETIGGEHDTSDESAARERRSAPRFLRQYKIQEVIRRRQILLIQVVKEERGTKGAALTTYVSLAGRYLVLMPNSPRGGGVSRKITSAADRRRLKEITEELQLPRGMGMIVRTAGANRPKPEIRRDCEALLRLWDDIRDLTMKSVSPALIYEEASLIKRAIRDSYSSDVDEVLVDGEQGWRAARDFMRMMMPAHAGKVQLWRGNGQTLFARHQIEAQLEQMLHPTVQLRSGGYLVINQAEALVAIDVNSGRSTRERGIEETALRTNLEAAEEVARQLRLRDLAGLIVIDFIDMESRKHNAMVERRMKEALANDRARIQLGSISHFGLMEMSRQRLRPSLAETSFVTCPHCEGMGMVRSTENAALHVLRAIEEEGSKRRASEIVVHTASSTALYILNHKRDRLPQIESRFGMRVIFSADETQISPIYRIERLRTQIAPQLPHDSAPIMMREIPIEASAPFDAEDDDFERPAPQASSGRPQRGNRDTNAAPGVAPEERPARDAQDSEGDGRRRRRRRRRGGRREDQNQAAYSNEQGATDDGNADLNDDDQGSDEHGVHAPAHAAMNNQANASSLQDSAHDDATGTASDDDTTEDDDAHGGASGDTGRTKRRGRRGGRRRSSREDSNAQPLPMDAPQPVYVGPTPADPYGGGAFDIFDALEQALMPHESQQVTTVEAEVEATLEPALEPAQAHQAQAVTATQDDAAEPVEAPPPARAPRARAPRGRTRTAKERQDSTTQAPAAPAVPEASVAQASAPAPAVNPAVNGAHAPQAAVPQAVASQVEADDQPTQGPAVLPVLISDAPTADKKRGWWRRS